MKYTEKDIDELFAAILASQVTPTRLPEDLYTAIFSRLMDAVNRGMDGTEELGSDLMPYFERNIGVFSAAKTHQQVVDMSKKVLDENGLRKSFAQFKRDAREIFDEYNVNWLETEYRTAFLSSQGAAQWLDFEDDRDVSPMLRYDTAGDQRVRPDHEVLDGIVRHIDDDFWKINFPPNDWNCRCDVSAYAEEDVEETPPEDFKDIKHPDELFRFNPALDKRIFDLHRHPYTKVADRYKVLKKNDFNLPVPQKPE